jgi:ComF family protein
MLAEVIAKLEPGFSATEVLLIPVPLHVSKQKQREFNQAEIIARAALRLRSHARLKLSLRILERRRATQSQIGLSSHQRRENLRGAFSVSDQDVKDREVLLIDDVFTTGTTVSECARVLRRAGASKVWVATVARTLKFEQQAVEQRFVGEYEMEPLTARMAAAG